MPVAAAVFPGFLTCRTRSSHGYSIGYSRCSGFRARSDCFRFVWIGSLANGKRSTISLGLRIKILSSSIIPLRDTPFDGLLADESKGKRLVRILGFSLAASRVQIVRCSLSQLKRGSEIENLLIWGKGEI